MTRAWLAVLLLAGCAGDSPCGSSEATVIRIVDGDTVELDDGRKVRYLLVDTPESTNGPTACYRQNAQQFNTDLVLTKTVNLSYDVECTDRYGRTLAYVTVDGQEVNSLMIQRGYGCVLHIPPDGDARLAEFQSLQRDAMLSNRGLWGECDPLPPACR